MCARLFLSATPEEIAALLEIEVGDLPPLVPRYNIAPGQDILVARADSVGKRRASTLRWGLVPRWAKEASIGHRLINARSETASGRAVFRDSLRWRRCLVPAAGFYEWKKIGGVSQPYAVRSTSGLVAIAGLWDAWEGNGTSIETCTLLTTEANERMASVHDRMPVLLDRSQITEWLDPGHGPEDVASLLKPYPSDRLIVEPVSVRVNRVDFDDPSCPVPVTLDPLPVQGRLF